jgi:hypothetical protein
MLRKYRVQLLAISTGVLIFSSVLSAQGNPEVAVFGGGTTFDQEGGTHPVLGGSFSAEIRGRLRLFGEFDYISLGKATFSGDIAGVSVSSTAKARLYDFGGGVDFSFRRGSSKAAPYLIAAAGLGHQSLSATGVGVMGTSRATVDYSESANAAHFGVGGGIRLYAGRNWGIKPEFRYQRYQSSEGNNNALFYTVGLFFQFGR